MSERFLRRKLDDEEIWVDLEKGQFYGLNETASRILELVREGEEDSAAIARRLTEEFEVSLSDAQAAVDSFLVLARKRELTGEG